MARLDVIGNERLEQVTADLASSRTTGEKTADWVSVFAGSWPFIIGFTAGTVVWVVANHWLPRPWDPKPYGVYTFTVSALAIVMSAIILLAGRRQAALDRAHAENAYQATAEIQEMVKRIHDVTLTQQDLMEDIHTIAQNFGIDLPTPAPNAGT